MRTQKIVIGNLVGQKIRRAVCAGEAIGITVIALEGAIIAFHGLLEWSVLPGNLIIILETDDAFNIEMDIALGEEILSQQIKWMAIEDQSQVLGNFLELNQDIIDDTDGGGSIPIGGNAKSKDAASQAVNNQIDIMPGAGDANVGFIAADLVGRLVIVVSDEGIDELGNGGNVVLDGDMGTGHTMNFAQNSGCLAQG